MWTLPRRDLKCRLTLQIAAVSALCFFATWAYFIAEADRSARTRMRTIAEISARELELQQDQANWMRSSIPQSPNLSTVASTLMAPGLCIAYRVNGGETLQRFCSGTESEQPEPPRLFAVLYSHLFHPGREVARTVSFRGRKMGETLVWVDPVTLTAQAWHDAGRLITVLIAALVLLCGLVYAALSSALRPTRLIRTGLERIAANDLSARLPPFDLAELSAIGHVFNHLAEGLGTALAERNELTRRLISLQDDERRHLARELHDEFGQCLAAIRALAASAGQSAATECPAILAECEGISRTATRMMESLRGTLFRLRPPDVDELGLVGSLQGLIAGWNGCSRGGTRFEIQFCGAFDSLPATVNATLYRIAQEALTNAAQHAGATRVVLQLTECPARLTDVRARGEIELSVEDDGRVPRDRGAKPGMGLLGMRERVAALDGRLSFESGYPQGSALRVVIPLMDSHVLGAAVCPACTT